MRDSLQPDLSEIFIGADVYWADGYSNDPNLYVRVSSEPDRSSFLFEEKDGYYFAENPDGLIKYVYKNNPAVPDEGFGGAQRTVRMKDGSERSWIGGWATSPSACTRAGFPEFIEVSLRVPQYERTAIGGYGMQIPLARAILAKFLPDVELVNINYVDPRGLSAPVELSAEQAAVVGGSRSVWTIKWRGQPSKAERIRTMRAEGHSWQEACKYSQLGPGVPA